MDAIHTDSSSRTCACGCGQPLVSAASVKPSNAVAAKQRYLKGHQWRDPAFHERRSSGIKQAYRDGKMSHVKNRMTEERRAAHAQAIQKAWDEGRLDRKKVSAGISKAWAEGRYDTETMRESQASRRRGGASASQMDTIRELRDMDKLKVTLSAKMTKQRAEWEASGKMAEIKEKQRKKMIGSGGFGTFKRGLPNHRRAKTWHLRDPNGVTHKFSNLREWARKHMHLFHDDYPAAKLPFDYRIAKGIEQLQSKNGKVCSYKGCVLVSKQEFIRDGEEDPLERTAQSDTKE